MTSRLIVKNLPNGIKEERLQSIFGKYGQVTDCSLKFTKDGKFRKFAFIGYRDQQEAETAVKQLNKTFIDTARIQVEYAKDFSDVNKPRAWSKYAKDSTAFQKTEKTNKDYEDKTSKKQKNEKKKETKEKALDDMLGELKDDPEFEEFMEAHQRKGNKPVWDNDVVVHHKEMKDKMSDIDDSSSGVESEVENMEDGDNNDDDDDKESNDKSFNVTKKDAVKKNVSDKEYLMSKVSDSMLLSDSSDDDGDDSDDEDNNSDDDEDSNNHDDEKNEEEFSVQKSSSKSKTKEKTNTEDNLSKSKENKDKKLDKKFVIKMKGLQGSALEKSIKEFFHPLETSEIRIPRNAKKKPIGIAYVDFNMNTDLDQAMRRNKNFLNGKRIFLKKCQEEEIDVSIATTQRPWESKERENGGEGEDETIAESGRLFVRNLAYTATDEELETLFGKYGPLTECNLPVDSQTKKIKGFAHVTYMMPEHAVKAYSELDGTIFMGRMLHILPGKSRADEDMETAEGSSYKNLKKTKQKSMAASAHNWNTLFLGANAVADVMAEKYSTSKSQILDAESKQSLGVRMALGETQLVSETRDFLLENGVSLDSFSQPSAARSRSVILVKNLPAGTKVEELRNIFTKHGSVGRVVMPPSGITAIVEYLEPTEAKKGFKLLAYSKFQHVPLYLEWAPVDVFMKKSEKNETEKDKKEEEANVKEKDEEEPGDVEERNEDGCTLFVKNINFDSLDEDFKKVFEQCGKVKSATIAKKKDIKNPGKFLSMGYGFVEFKNKRGVEKAMRELQHTVLDGHTLELKISNRSTLQPKSSKKPEKTKLQDISTKILVRNIPFEAHRKEIFDLFKVFGELKSVRLPKKLSGTGSHRGFGFVDFLTKQDAKRAFEALCHSTHLFGRRLVLEWAQTTEDLDELRKKTAKHYHEDVPKKKLKKSSIMEDLDMAE